MLNHAGFVSSSLILLREHPFVTSESFWTMLDLPKNLVVIESSNSDGPREDFFIEKLLTFVKKLELLKVSGSRNKVVDPQILPKNFLDLKVTKSNVSIGFVKNVLLVHRKNQSLHISATFLKYYSVPLFDFFDRFDSCMNFHVRKKLAFYFLRNFNA